MNAQLQAALEKKIALLQARLADLEDFATCTEAMTTEASDVEELGWGTVGSLGHVVELLTQATDHFNITGTIGKTV